MKVLEQEEDEQETLDAARKEEAERLQQQEELYQVFPYFKRRSQYYSAKRSVFHACILEKAGGGATAAKQWKGRTDDIRR